MLELETRRRLLIGVLVASAIGIGVLVFLGRPPARPHYTGVAAVVEQFQCYRCHDAPGKLVPAVREKHCIRCHQAVHAGGFDAEFAADRVAKWKQNIVHLTRVPSLIGIERRLRRDWLIEFLQRPHDLRPNLDAEMPRLRIGPDDARAIADHFIPVQEAAEPPTLGDPTRGRDLFVANDCVRCHHYTGSGLAGPKPSPLDEVRLAPDLRHTRVRMSAAAVLTWLTNPREVKSDTLMPTFTLDPDQRRDLAAFVLTTDLAPVTSSTPPTRLPILDRRVTHAEVERRVFKRICWHCHSDPEPAGGDGGPGNTGGFGFAGKGLDFGTYEAILRGGRDEQGGKLDVLAADGTGTPRVVAAMMARHAEVAGHPSPRRGMPLGLPPMSLEEIQLVESWIAQGHPRE